MKEKTHNSLDEIRILIRSILKEEEQSRYSMNAVLNTDANLTKQIHQLMKKMDSVANKYNDMQNANRIKQQDLEIERKNILLDMENDPDIELSGGTVADTYGIKLDKVDSKMEALNFNLLKTGREYDAIVAQLNDLRNKRKNLRKF